jgi:hypothetical protein
MAHAVDRAELIAFLLGEYRQELEGLTDEELLGYLQALKAVQRLPAETWHGLFTAEAGDRTHES